jgi:hypothetical protein
MRGHELLPGALDSHLTPVKLGLLCVGMGIYGK